MLVTLPCVLSGCTSAFAQAVGRDTRGEDLRVDSRKSTSIRFVGDSSAEFAHVRVAGDTVLAWRSVDTHERVDAVAIPLRNVESIEQRHVDPTRTIQVILLSGIAVLIIGLLGLFLLLSTDTHS